jgi:hypothetical protein
MHVHFGIEQQVLEYLEAKPVPPGGNMRRGTVPIFVSAKMGLSPLPVFGAATAPLPQKSVQPLRRADEARTAVAVCLRWGSYFAVLADPSKPNAPNIDDRQVSQIDDEEMARMNTEISAGAAWRLALAGFDDRRDGDLVARAPLP